MRILDNSIYSSNAVPCGGAEGSFFFTISSKNATCRFNICNCVQDISNDSASFTFTGKEKDSETGYGYFGARYMDHELMTMWLSVDPMADKYPSISPYAYCAWNPVRLVDPDGNEAIDNDDWYINGKGEMKWFNSTAEKYTYEGEEYTRFGQTASMTNSDGEFVYGDQYGNTHSSKPLKEVSITETLTDFERTMRNPLVQSVHQSAASFWGNPVTIGAIAAMGSIIGFSEVAFAISSGDWVFGIVASYSVGESAPSVSTTARHIKEWLGDGRGVINKHNDPIFVSKDGLRQIRFDINHPSPHKNPHVHLETRETLKKPFKIIRKWPKDVKPE